MTWSLAPMVIGPCKTVDTRWPHTRGKLEQVAGEKSAQKMIAEMVTDWTHYSKDTAKLADVRQRIDDRLATHFLAHTSQDKAE